MTKYDSKHRGKTNQDYIKPLNGPELKPVDLNDTAKNYELEQERRKEHQRRKTR